MGCPLRIVADPTAVVVGHPSTLTRTRLSLLAVWCALVWLHHCTGQQTCACPSQPLHPQGQVRFTSLMFVSGAIFGLLVRLWEPYDLSDRDVKRAWYARRAMRFEAILPKRYHSSKQAKKGLDVLLRTFGVEAQRRLKKYPAQQPTDYVRTGNLGRNWEGTPNLKSGESVTLTNPTPYAVWVQGPNQGSGPKQAGVMAGKGWPSITTVGEEAAKAAIKKWEDLPDDQKA